MTGSAHLGHDGHPLGRVAAALDAGAGSVAELARRCGLSTGEAQTALVVLESIGRARRAPLQATADCGPLGCSGCSLRTGCATATFGGGLQTWQRVPGSEHRA